MDRSIDYVIAVAECKSISQAAEMLYISQPSLSRYLSNLENELGVNLFVRTLNGTELTAAGKIYLEYAKEIKLLKETMISKLKELKREKKSRIRIGMPLNAASLAALMGFTVLLVHDNSTQRTYLLFHTLVCSMRLATRCRSFALSTASICR